MGDDAEGAAVIAAALYRDEGRRRIFPLSRHIFVMFPGSEFGVARTVTLLSLTEQLGKVSVPVRPDDQIHPGDLCQQRRTEPLCHTADHPQNRADPFVALQLPDPA